ncbi:MAG: 50S ribosomal protein L17 [Microgenomates group bacterium]
MRHRVKKIKVKGGKDANKMLMVKLVNNFFVKGKLTTTIKKAKLVKSYIERLVEKSKVKTEANKNYLLRYIHDKKLINFLFETVGPAFKSLKGGYVRIIRIGQRDSDGSEIGKLEWTQPITQ